MHSRAYQGEQDLAALSQLVAEAWAEHGPHVECTVGDLCWRMYRNAQVRPEENLQLWFDEGRRLVGFAWWYANGDVDLLVHPRRHAELVVPEMLGWAQERSRRAGSLEGTGRVLTAWALEGNAPLSAALERQGWVRSGGCYLHLARSLEDLPPASAPHGYTIRSVRGPEEAAARAAVHRRAFGSERVTTEVYQRLMKAPLYRAHLDLVAQAPGGELAALALCWWDEQNQLGEFEPVATAPEHRRQGLARALLLEGMRRLRQLGARRALVYALADNPGSSALYLSLGFRPVDRNWGYVSPRLSEHSALGEARLLGSAMARPWLGGRRSRWRCWRSTARSCETLAARVCLRKTSKS